MLWRILWALAFAVVFIASTIAVALGLLLLGPRPRSPIRKTTNCRTAMQIASQKLSTTTMRNGEGAAT
jgi:hypothetical protein